MPSIVVTGGAGFLGSHLCDTLIAGDAKVICVDNFFTGQKKNIEHLRQNPNFKLLEHDIVEPLELSGIDQIYNLACPASPVHYQHDPIKTVQTSTVGMVNMLNLAEKNKARLLQASTSEIYGDPEVHPQPEEYWGNVNPIGERSCYDEGKRVAETLCLDYHREKGVEVRIARIFNTYGPRMHPNDGRVVSNFIVQTIQNQPITIYGDGSQTRSFCYVDDLITGLVALMNQDQTTGPINLGNPEELTIKRLAELITAQIESTSSIVYQALPEDDPKQRQPDITKATDILAWQPVTSLSAGLPQTIEYFTSLKL
ncbi:SDR family oxidoreductase [Patescibacteria group bacterium]|nr:SDR family oxidoreductase [Patescibacteria group bacterium]